MRRSDYEGPWTMEVGDLPAGDYVLVVIGRFPWDAERNQRPPLETAEV